MHEPGVSTTTPGGACSDGSIRIRRAAGLRMARRMARRQELEPACEDVGCRSHERHRLDPTLEDLGARERGTRRSGVPGGLAPSAGRWATAWQTVGRRRRPTPPRPRCRRPRHLPQSLGRRARRYRGSLGHGRVVAVANDHMAELRSSAHASMRTAKRPSHASTLRNLPTAVTYRTAIPGWSSMAAPMPEMPAHGLVTPTGIGAQ
jgi:hypothetical protein